MGFKCTIGMLNIHVIMGSTACWGCLKLSKCDVDLRLWRSTWWLSVYIKYFLRDYKLEYKLITNSIHLANTNDSSMMTYTTYTGT